MVWRILGVAVVVHRDPVLVQVAQVDQEEEEKAIGMMHFLQEELQIPAVEEAQVVPLTVLQLAVMAAQDLFFFGIH